MAHEFPGHRRKLHDLIEWPGSTLRGRRDRVGEEAGVSERTLIAYEAAGSKRLALVIDWVLIRTEWPGYERFIEPVADRIHERGFIQQVRAHTFWGKDDKFVLR